MLLLLQSSNASSRGKYSPQILTVLLLLVSLRLHLTFVAPCRIRHYVESMQMLCHKAMQNLC